MSINLADKMRTTVDAVYRAESRRVFATLIGRIGDFDLAERLFGESIRKEKAAI